MGQFSPPPLVPFLIKIGYIIAPSEIGVRTFYLLLHMLTLICIERITRPTDDKLFIVILSSFGVMHIGGLLAVPDVPFLFFSALLILVFDNYAKKSTFLNSILLALSLALIMYSKYHGIIVIIALLIANHTLFRRPSFYGVGFLAILFFSPHLFWLYQNDWVSINYHFNHREQTGYHWHYPFMYLGGLLLISGPFMGLLFLIPSFKYRVQNQLEKNLKVVLVVVCLFFFILSFRNRIEANWLVVVIIPLFVLGYKVAITNDRLRNWIYRSFPLTLALAIAARVLLTLDIVPADTNLFKKLIEIHNNKLAVQIIEKEADGLPIIFQRAHQLPSKYLFYSLEKNASNIIPLAAHPSEFLLMHDELKYQGQKVYLEQFLNCAECETVTTPIGDYYFKRIEKFCSYAHAQIDIIMANKTFEPNSSIKVPIHILNFDKLDLSSPEAKKSYVSYFIIENDKFLKSERCVPLTNLIPTNGHYTLNVTLPNKAGRFSFRVTIWSDDIVGTYNGDFKTILICN